jgi:HrpJ-like domain
MLDQVASSRYVRDGQKPTSESHEQTRGIWQGQSISLRQERDVDSAIRRTEYRQKAGLDSPADHRSLMDRTISVDARSLSLSADMLGKLAKVFGGDGQTTKLAQSYLKHFQGEQNRPQQDSSLNSLVQHYVGLQKLATALKGDQADFVSRMTPLPDGNPKLQELAERLQEAGDDTAKMQELLSQVEGLPTDPDELHGLMKTLRFNPKELKNKLRDAQKLPELDSNQTEKLLEHVEDALLQLEIEEGSRLKAARNSIEKGFESGDPEKFVESYSGALKHTGSFLQTFTELIQRHKPSELSNIIPLMKQVLADELRLDQEERSTDKIKLESLFSELSFMHISSTLLEKINRLISGMKRIYGQPTAA